MGEQDWGRWQVILGIIGIIITLGSLLIQDISPSTDNSNDSVNHNDPQNETPTETLSPVGSISVASSPSGASVYLDDKYQGITPMTLNNTEQGSHRILLKLAGYEEYSQTAIVDTGKEVPILAILTPETSTGDISVTSYPVGASISLDGIYRGETPKVLEDIEQGSHIITLKFAGYEDWSQSISVDSDKVFSLSPTLTAEPTTEVTDTSTPSGEIESVWFENGVWDYDAGSNGVRIHTSFNTYNLKDEECLAAALFYNNFDNTQLRDNNGEYTFDGKVIVYDYFTPEYVDSSYNDFTLFIPYNELHMNPGTADIRFEVVIMSNDNILDTSDWYDFSFIQY